MAVKMLSELKNGEKGKIIKIGGKGNIHKRLLDMGLVSGSEVTVQRKAPLGDPIEIRVKGYYLSLRKDEASSIQVEISS
ncbi:MAG: ferrous iron transport protein A [Thermotogota bacterium]|nr:ferrous iron transport protein A [Thermotogota bacterium]